MRRFFPSTIRQAGATPPSVDYSTFEVLYSFARKLNPSYGGNAFRIIRSSDNAQQDIGFIGSEVDSAAISTFCSGTVGKIHTVYNQGTLGSIYDMVTLVTAKPIIYESGAIITINSKPAAKTDPATSAIMRAANIVTANGIHDKDGLQKSLVHKRNTTGTLQRILILERDNTLSTMAFNVFDDLRAVTSTSPTMENTINVGSSIMNYPDLQTAGEITISSSDYYVESAISRGTGLKNSVQFYDDAQVRNWTSTNPRFFDMWRAGGDFVIQEYVARIKPTTDKDLAGITAIADEQNAYYGIY